MDIKFMTPTEVWEDFEQTNEALENSIVSQETNDNIVCSKQYFTSSQTQDGPLRAFCEIYYDMRWTDKRPALLLLPPLYKYDFRDIAKRLVQEGYVVSILDYCSNMLGDNQTVYPELLNFAKWPECSNNLTTFNGNPKHTPYYIWASITRRTISLLCQLSIVDETKIGIIGSGVGSQIAWIVSGIDKRVGAIVAINGGGYVWAKTDSNGIQSNIPKSDEESAFSTSIGAETYARMVTCPTLVIASSNSTYYNLDKANDIISNIKTDNKTFIVSQGSDTQITHSCFDMLCAWLREDFLFDKFSPNHPTISLETIENKLYFKLNTIHACTERNIYISYNEPYSYARSWEKLTKLQKINLHEYIGIIPVGNADNLINIYATMKYKNDTIESTKIVSVNPMSLSIEPDQQFEDQTERIIYNGSMGNGTFTAVTDSAILNENALEIKSGPFEIKGISSIDGSLYLRHNAKDLKSITKSGLLHFDVYSPKEKSLKLTMYSYPDRKPYYTTIELSGGEYWQNILLDCSDFKSLEGKPLQDFNYSKLFRIKDVAGLIFNNFLWI